MNAPLVSVVMATYNRSNLLQFSIGSLLRGTYQDWELIVVGDCCTDDTEQVVASFKDSRIRFVNLSVNYGEQSGPNNEGIALARGYYVAFLNHDDMWCDNHLRDNIALLVETDADLVFSQGLVVPFQAPLTLTGAVTGIAQLYEPWMIVPATLWVFKRSLAAKIGEWSQSGEIRTPPSQDWLYRAYRCNVKMVANPILSAFIVNSGSRVNAYSERQELEHQYWFNVAVDQIMTQNAVTAAFGAHIKQETTMSLSFATRQWVRLLSRKILLQLNVWPPQLMYWLRYRRKGSFIKHLRKRRGLPIRSSTK